MQFFDIWTILTGIASILSLILVMSDKFPEWKKYTAPAGFALGGFALGRISTALVQGTTTPIQDTRIFGFLLVISIVLGVFLLFLRIVSKTEREWGYIVFILGLLLVFGMPNLLEKYSAAFPDVPKEDYLLLATVKEERADLAGAVKYLEKYKSLTQEYEIKQTVEKKIHNIQNKQLIIK